MQNKVFAIFFGATLSILTFNLQANQSNSSGGVNEALKQASHFCQQKIDPMMEQMAKQAGYDVEKLCKSLKHLSIPNGDELAAPNMLARSTQPEKNKPKKQSQKSDQEPAGTKGVEQSDQLLQPELNLFGYDLFAGEPVTFQPSAHVPVEPDYSLGPGDELRIQFYGKVNDYFEQTISRDGAISFPNIGPLGVAGMTFQEAKQLISRKVSEEYIGVNVSISVGALRSITIYVLGEAYKPGLYTVPSLSTITNVLFLSGGVTDIASLRNIQLKRDGKLRTKLDLYDLLLSGDRSKDSRLEAGDTIFIPPLGQTASIDGQIRRPAMYELKSKPTIRELIKLGGGLLPTAYRSRARILRVDDSGFMTVLDIDLNKTQSLDVAIKNGDRLVVDAVADKVINIVTLSGNLYHPGQFLWEKGLKISHLIPTAELVKTDTDLGYALLRRELKPSGKVITFFVDLTEIFADPASASNYLLQKNDELIIFSNDQDRAERLAGLVAQLKQQARINEVSEVVTIDGVVQYPGDYPMTQDMSLTQLIASSGGLQEEAFKQVVELTRSDFSGGEKVVLSHLTIDLGSILSGEHSDIMLNPYDKVSIRSLPQYRQAMTITLRGEVLLPGEYSFLVGETLSSVIARAGGFTSLAHIDAAIFTRDSLRQREIQKINLLRDQVKADIITANLHGDKTVSVENETKILDQLDRQSALGRLVIDLKAIVNGDTNDIGLRNGDQLIIPEYRQEVSIMGEVPWPSAHQFDSNLNISDYLGLAGGAKMHADKKRIYVVKVNGSVEVPKGVGWPMRRNFSIDPGDTIVVPINMDRKDPLDYWSEVTRVIYQLSLGAAALKNL